MRRSLNRGLVAALEAEEGLTPVDEIVAVEPIGDGAESVEQSLLDIEGEAADGEQLAADTEQAVETAEALEAIHEQLTLSAANGGLDKYAAAAIDTSLRYMYRSIGAKPVAMPAMESFGGTSTRIQATTIALESIAEQAKKIWEKIKQAIAKAFEWIKNFYAKVFDGADKLVKRSQQLEGKVQDLQGAPAEKQVTSSRLVTALHVGGSVNVPANLSKTDEAIKQIFGAAESENVVAATEAVKFLSDANVVAKVLEFKLPAYKLPGMSDASSAGFNAPKAGLAVFRSGELLGGKALLAFAPKADLSGKEAIAAYAAKHTEIGNFNPKAGDPKGDKLPTLSPEDMVKVCKSVQDMGDALVKWRATSAKLDSLRKEILGAVDKAAAASSKDDKEANKENLAHMRTLATAAARTVDQPAVSASKWAVNTGNALLQYVETSAKQYGKGAVPAKAAA